MAIKLFLNSQTIMDRVFPVVSKNAYDATEVDKFLDMIIQDYRTVEANILVVKKDYEQLTEKNKNLEKEKRDWSYQIFPKLCYIVIFSLLFCILTTALEEWWEEKHP